MTASLDYLKPYADTVTPGSARRIEDRRHGGWLLELERALLANGTTTSAPRHHHDDVERHRDAGDLSPPPRLPMPFETAAIAVPEVSRADQARDIEHPETIVPLQAQSRPEIAQTHGDTSHTTVTTQSAVENDGQGDAPLQQGSPYSGTAAPAGFYLAGNSYLLPVQQQAFNSKDLVISAAKPQDLWPSRMSLPRGISEVPYFTDERAAEPVEQAEADAVAASQDTETFQESEAYPRRKMHLFHSDDGIHAWIRDIDVDDTSAHVIASALNAELAASGLKLAALTLNGKRLAQPFQDERFDDEERAESGGVLKAEGIDDLPSQATQQITEKGAY